MQIKIYLLVLFLASFVSHAALQSPTCPKGSTSTSPPRAFSRAELCCFVPSNISAATTKFYHDICTGAANQSVPNDLATNLAAVKQMRESYQRMLDPIPALQYLTGIRNDSIDGVPVVWASPKGNVKAATASTTGGGTSCSGSSGSCSSSGSGSSQVAKEAAKDSSAGKLVMYLHGGGYIFGSCYSQLTAVAIAAGEAGAAQVVCPDYRLAPENPFPAGLNDVAAVYAALLKAPWNYQPQNIAVLGDSAGGGLVFALLLLLKQRGMPLPGAAGAYSPWVELSGAPDTFATTKNFDILVGGDDGINNIGLAYVGAANAAKLTDPLVSPIYGDYSVGSKVLPPVLIQVGLRETLLADATLIFRKLRSSGQCAFLSPWVGMWHVFQYLGFGNPEGLEAQREMGQFFKRHLGKASSEATAGSTVECCW
jgi:acetyl esterase/lipase